MDYKKNTTGEKIKEDKEFYRREGSKDLKSLRRVLEKEGKGGLSNLELEAAYNQKLEINKRKHEFKKWYEFITEGKYRKGGMEADELFPRLIAEYQKEMAKLKSPSTSLLEFAKSRAKNLYKQTVAEKERSAKLLGKLTRAEEALRDRRFPTDQKELGRLARESGYSTQTGNKEGIKVVTQYGEFVTTIPNNPTRYTAENIVKSLAGGKPSRLADSRKPPEKPKKRK